MRSWGLRGRRVLGFRQKVVCLGCQQGFENAFKGVCKCFWAAGFLAILGLGASGPRVLGCGVLGRGLRIDEAENVELLSGFWFSACKTETQTLHP